MRRMMYERRLMRDAARFAMGGDANAEPTTMLDTEQRSARKLAVVSVLNSELLREIVERLVAEFHPERIILFGSYAWGTPSQDSDLDLLVVVPDSPLSPAQRAARAHRVLRGIGIPKDVLVRTHEEVERYRLVPASLEAEILERGRPLYR
jgi:uncharacterized protein